MVESLLHRVMTAKHVVTPVRGHGGVPRPIRSVGGTLICMIIDPKGGWVEPDGSERKLEACLIGL
jgi:hypothetical protein